MNTSGCLPRKKSYGSREFCPWFLALAATISLLLLVSCRPERSLPTSGPSVAPFVRGYIASAVGGGNVDFPTTAVRPPLRDVFLPGVKVFLRQPGTDADSAPVTTDLSGRFTLMPQTPGDYQVCWKARGFLDDCTKPMAITAPVNLSTLRINVDRQQDTTIVFGEVRMADGSLPRVLEPMANVNSFAKAGLLDKAGALLSEAYVNNFGDYLLPQVPVRAEMLLRMKIEGATTDQRISPEANLAGSPVHAINLQIRNYPPRLEPLVAQDAAGRRVAVAQPGATLQLIAHGSDRDADPLSFTWVASDGSGTLNSTAGSSVQWTLPNQQGLYSVTLIAYDGKGGYDRSRLVVRADTQGILFTGTVNSTTGAVVPDAQVEVNGKTATTDATGFFRMHVPDADRFVLNIRKVGFGLVSQIYDRGIIGGHWTMTPATVLTADPTQPIDVIDQRQPNKCPGPLSDRLDWKGYSHAAQPQWQDGKGMVVAPFAKLDFPLPAERRPPQEQQCGPGIRMQIPANSLQDENGIPPAGNVQISLSTVDLLSPDQMPGDYTVRQQGQPDQVMQSYGAGVVEITAAGMRYNLKPGATATVTLPVDPSQLAAGGPLPATIPLLFYDEKSGVWVPEGTATLQSNVYVATVQHFSALNVDLVKVNQSCVRVNSPTLSPNYKLEVTIPLGGGAAPKVFTMNINNAPPSQHVIYNLPSHTNIVLVPIRINNNIPMGTFIVNTGGPQNPTSPNLPAGPPYNACSTEVILTEQTLLQVPRDGQFLHGLYSFAAANLDELDPNAGLKQQLDQATANYYAQIDPRTKRPTLQAFRTVNGFDGTETRVVYANSGDLGFGREMYCKQSGADAACYVTNYGDLSTDDNTDVSDAVSAVQSPGSKTPVATVAMEYSRIENPPGNPYEFTDPDLVVKFYVYNSAGDALLRAANLDLEGPRPIPQLCMVCHGGQYLAGSNTGAPTFNSRADVKLGSVFLPFDLHNFTFSGTAGFTKADQQAAFKTLNDIVKATNPTQAITDVIDKMYDANPAQQDENFVTTGWTGQPIEEGMYRDVVARACRTCHAANSIATLRFNEKVQMTDILGSVETRVCTEHVMPHARRTHDLFWQSVDPHQPAQLQIFGDTFKTPNNGWKGDQCGVFTGGGPTPISPFTEVQNLLTAKCTRCHIGGSPPAGLHLTAGQAHSNLVNVDACELLSMKRVKPNDTAASYLYKKVTLPAGSPGLADLPGCSLCTVNTNTSDCGKSMPRDNTPSLGAADVAKITNWINAGAPP